MRIKLGKKNRIFLDFAGVAILVFVSFNVALASEINRENIIQLVNQSRNNSGFESLIENEKLDKAAEEKAEDMIAKNYFSHNSPEGVTPWYWFDKNGYDYKYAGENLALGFSSAEDEHEAWMESPTHRKNILNPNYGEIGVAVKNGRIDGKFVIVAVQMFGSRIKNGVVEGGIENNISDEKSEEMMEKNKNDNQGIILKTENKNSDGTPGNLVNGGDSGSSFSFRNLKKYLGSESFVDYIKFISITSMLLYFIFNLISIFIMIFNNIINCMKIDKNVSRLVHSLAILIIFGSIIL